MFVKPFVMSYLLQGHLRLIKSLILAFSMFTLMEDVTRFIVSVVFRKWPIDNCHVVSFKLHPAWVNEICTLAVYAKR